MKTIASLAVCVASAFAQGQVYEGPPISTSPPDCWRTHLSQLPPPPASCVHQGTALGVVEYSEITTTVTTPPAFVVTLAGECGVWPCNQAPPRTIANCGYSSHTQTCWSVGGSLSVQGKTSLLLRLFGELDITVEINGSLTNCTETGYSAGITSVINHCRERDCKISEVVTTVTGTATEHAEVAAWLCQLPSGMIVDVRTECGTSSATGSVDYKVRTRIWFGLERPLSDCSPCGELC